MERFESVTVIKAPGEFVVTVALLEGVAQDVAAYFLVGNHSDARYVQEHGRKLPEAAARDLVAWPSRLEYRR